MNPITALREGTRILYRAIRVKKQGFKQYKGSAEQICTQIIESCWNGKYFQVSSGHFCEFYMRDFGWCVDSLIKLGYKQRCLKSLDWALNVYASKGKLATTITPYSAVEDIYTYSPDSLGYLMRTLKRLDAKKLVEKYRIFIDNEVKKFYNIAFDKNTGIIRKDRYFSSMKDHSKRKSSCYDNCWLYVISDALDYFNLDNPFKRWDFKKQIEHHFWHGHYFLDDLSGSMRVAGDANTFPFWLGIFKEKSMLKLAVKTMQDNGLDKPFPLKYEKERTAKLNLIDRLVPDYETNAIWVHMAFPYIEIVSKISKKKAEQYLDQYRKLIEKHKNFLEIYTSEGRPYKTMLYVTDESMLWCANWLWLSKRLKIK